MRLSDIQYDLPAERIAQHAVEPRDAARLLVLDRSRGAITHRRFREIGEYLSPGDCLVLNDTRVIPARFFCRRMSGGRVEALFLHVDGAGWQVLFKPGGRLKVGERLACTGADLELVLVDRLERGAWRVRPEPDVAPPAALEAIGQTPLPPYIRRDEPEAGDGTRYQTVYARVPGAVAAPTAGMHFTETLLEGLAAAGVRRADVTLHVGVGTFSPIETEELAAHVMHAEWFAVGAQAAETLRRTRAEGGRIVAVGTTATRVLESLPAGGAEEAFRPREGWTDLFIYPPYEFRHVDRMVTNFHLPGSTLLALVMAFASEALIRRAYAEAIAEEYRFYSYGDAMIML